MSVLNLTIKVSRVLARDLFQHIAYETLPGEFFRLLHQWHCDSEPENEIAALRGFTPDEARLAVEGLRRFHKACSRPSRREALNIAFEIEQYL